MATVIPRDATSHAKSVLQMRKACLRLVNRYVEQNQLVTAEFWASHLVSLSNQAGEICNVDESSPFSGESVPTDTPPLRQHAETHRTTNGPPVASPTVVESSNKRRPREHRRIRNRHTEARKRIDLHSLGNLPASREEDDRRLGSAIKHHLVNDVTLHAQILSQLGQHHRAAHLICSQDYHKIDLKALLTTVQSLHKAGELEEAMDALSQADDLISKCRRTLSSVGQPASLSSVSDGENDRNVANFCTTPDNCGARRRSNCRLDVTQQLPDCCPKAAHVVNSSSEGSNDVVDDEAVKERIAVTAHNHGESKLLLASIYVVRGRLLEAMDNVQQAAASFRDALSLDPHCAEAFISLAEHQAIDANSGRELVNSLNLDGFCNSSDEADLLRFLYLVRTNKCDKPSQRIESMADSAAGVGVVALSASLFEKSTISKIGRRESDATYRQFYGPVSPHTFNYASCPDFVVQQAEMAFYNSQFDVCLVYTNQMLRNDPFHPQTLPIHIAALVQTGDTISLFTLAHKLIDVDPESAVAWYSVGCYYYAVGRQDFARRYLSKATALNRLFGPAWLAYGHSFGVENEHDQAMAAYFKACQLLAKCHLPLLYIGVEYALTSNLNLAYCFLKLATDIAPEDPFLLHELGVVHFQSGSFAEAENCMLKALHCLADNKLYKCDVGPESTRRLGGKTGIKFEHVILSGMWEPLLTNLGHVSRKLGKVDRAIDFHSQALVVFESCNGNDDGAAESHAAIGLCHALCGRNELAADALHRSLSLRRDHALASILLNNVISNSANDIPPLICAIKETQPVPKPKVLFNKVASLGPDVSKYDESASVHPANSTSRVVIDSDDATVSDLPMQSSRTVLSMLADVLPDDSSDDGSLNSMTVSLNN